MGKLAFLAAINPAFRYAVIESVDGVDDIVTPEVIDRWLRSHFVYRPEQNEVIREPEAMMEDLQATGHFEGDCDCVSTLAAAVLIVYGLPAVFVAIKKVPGPEFVHVFVESGSTRIDPTVPEGTEHQIAEVMTYGL
jgi:copper chaperone CopZ